MHLALAMLITCIAPFHVEWLVYSDTSHQECFFAIWYVYDMKSFKKLSTT